MDNRVKILNNAEELEAKMKSHSTMTIIEEYLIREVDNINSLFKNLQISRPQMAMELTRDILSRVFSSVFPKLIININLRGTDGLSVGLKINNETASYNFKF